MYRNADIEVRENQEDSTNSVPRLVYCATGYLKYNIATLSEYIRLARQLEIHHSETRALFLIFLFVNALPTLLPIGRCCRLFNMLPQVLQFLIFATVFWSLRALTGDHVCQRMENYTVTGRETYTTPVTIQTVSWCLKIPPRCSKSRTEIRERYRIRSEVKLRNISECCEGYEKEGTDEDAKCVPICDDCLNGRCVSPNNCQCDPGYRGESCAYDLASESVKRTCVPEHLQNLLKSLRGRGCGPKGTCDPIHGVCRCSPGWRGPRCEDKCEPGLWGQDCEIKCTCKAPPDVCDPETGECSDVEVGSAAQDWTMKESSRIIYALTVTEQTSATDSTQRIAGSTVFDNDWIEEYNKPVDSIIEENSDDNVATVDTRVDFANARLTIPSYLAEKIAERIPYKSVLPFLGTPVGIEGPRSLDPSRTNPSLDEEDDDEGPNGDAVTPKTDYVKTIRREDTSATSFDLTVLIVVGSVVSLCLTLAAVFLIFHVRSRLFETVSLSICNNDKNDGCQEKGNAGKVSKTVNGNVLPQPLTFPNPVYSANQDGTFISFDGAELLNKDYANRSATISIRLSDLLECHYDRPPAATCCHITDTNVEHVYDEIPANSPFCLRKET